MKSKLANKKFQRKIEDFVCENCGCKIIGDGYTNHCRYCLWSKHVDINPGDRAEKCHGMMKPIDLVNKDNIFYVVQQCVKCGFLRNNKAQKGDSFEALIEISHK